MESGSKMSHDFKLDRSSIDIKTFQPSRQEYNLDSSSVHGLDSDMKKSSLSSYDNFKKNVDDGIE